MKGKLTFRQAAVRFLEAIAEPMHYKKMMKGIQERGLMETSGKTPAETLRAMMMRDIKSSDDPTFGFFGDGKYGLCKWTGLSEREVAQAKVDVKAAPDVTDADPPRPAEHRKLIGRIGEGPEGTFLLAWVRRSQSRYLEISRLPEGGRASDPPVEFLQFPQHELSELARNLLILAGPNAIQELYNHLGPSELPRSRPPAPAAPAAPAPKPESDTATISDAAPSVSPTASLTPEISEQLRSAVQMAVESALAAALPQALSQAIRNGGDGNEPGEAGFASVQGAGSLEDVYQYLVDVHDLTPLCSFRPEISLPTSRSIDYLDRIQGCLMGCALGDAAGAPVQGLSPEQINRRFGGPIQGLVSGGPAQPVGAVTDDTQLTIAACESYVASGRFDPDDLAQRLAGVSLRDGENTIEGFRKKFSDHGMPWYEAGIVSARIGAAKRMAPTGLANLATPLRLRQEAAISAFITHRDDMAVAAAVAHAFAVAYLCHTPAGAFAEREHMLRFCERVGTAIAGIERSPHRERHTSKQTTLHDRISRELPRVLLDETLEPAELFQRWHNGSFALETLPCAFYCFLRHPNDFTRTLEAAVNGGYAADTIASLACSLSGAYNGRRKLPDELVDELPVGKSMGDLADRVYQSFGPST